MVDTIKKTGAAGEGKELPPPAPPRQRTSPIQFYEETMREMKKVTWPTVKETWLTTVMVFIMVGLTVVFFFFVDTILAFGERLLIGAG